MRSRSLAAAVAVGSAAWLFALAQPSVAAPQTASGETYAWSVEHGTADASGTRWLEPGDFLSDKLRIEGSLNQAGTGCSSFWVKWFNDLGPGMPHKVTTQCGAGSTPVSITASYLPTTGAEVAVCAGQTNTDDCGTWESVTWW